MGRQVIGSPAIMWALLPSSTGLRRQSCSLLHAGQRRARHGAQITAGRLVVRSAPCPPSPYAALRGSRPRMGTRQRPARSPASLHHLMMHRWHLTAASPQRCAAHNSFATRRKARKPKPRCAGDTSSLCAEVAVLQTERRRSGVLLQKAGALPCTGTATGSLHACGAGDSNK